MQRARSAKPCELPDKAAHRAHFPENVKLFGPIPVSRIDFGGFQPIFRFDAARHRNAMPRVSRLSAYPIIPSKFACRSGIGRDSLFPRFQAAVSSRGSMSFSHLGLSDKVLAAVAATGYTTPTPI